MKNTIILLTTCVLLMCSANKIFAQSTSGETGECTWELTGTDSNLTLTITGTGAMEDYTDYSTIPWYSHRENIKNIVISNGVTTIGNRAFSSCIGLTEITIPNSVTKIGVDAFSGCTGLAEIIIPDSVTEIGNFAFYNCTSLTSVTIGNSVTSIKSYAFYGCTGLTEITVKASVPPLLSNVGSVFTNLPANIPVYVPCGSLSAYNGNTSWNTIFGSHIQTIISAITLTQPTKSDTTVSIGTSSFTFAGDWTDTDDTFGDLTCHWEKNTGDVNNPDDWKVITGTENTSTDNNISSDYVITPVALSDRGYYRLVIDGTNGCCAMSDIIHLQVTVTVGADQTICYNTVPDPLISGTAPGGSGSYTYQWEQSTDGGSTWGNVAGGGTDANYTPPALTQTTMYRLKTACSDSSCEAVYSNTVYITVNASSASAFVDDIWYFGRDTISGGKSPGIKFVYNSVTGEYEMTDASGESMIDTGENSLVVSSPYCDGQSIFYSSHNKLYNSLHQPMLNGDFAGDRSVADGLAACYIGDNRYLFFSVTNGYDNNTPRGLWAYVVDMNLDNGMGGIVLPFPGQATKYYEIETKSNAMSETIELIAKAGTKNEYWLVYAYCDGSCGDGVSNVLRIRSVDVSDPYIPTIGETYTNTQKTTSSTYSSAVSQQKNRIAITNLSGSIDVFDFDNTNGTLTKEGTISITDSRLYGVEFSPDGNRLYYTVYYEGNSSSAKLYQYNLSNLSIDGPNNSNPGIQYWSQTKYPEKGGGLKLGPDGNIYVVLANSDSIGVISNPNYENGSADYSRKKMGSVVNGGLQFSTGLTRPAVMDCNLNYAPVPLDIDAALCASSVTVNVLRGVTDEDAGDAVFLTNAKFVNIADTLLATITVSPADSTVSLTLKSGVAIDESGPHVFSIDYYVKDDGFLASQCATGRLTISAYPHATADSIAAAVTVEVNCYGNKAPLEASLATAGSITNPIFRWYASQTSADVLFTGSLFRPLITADTAYYVSVSGDNICENATGDRRKVSVTLHPDASSAFVDDIWYFGANHQGIRFTKDSDGIYTATPASNESKVDSRENSLVVSSPYCDGQDIFYASHNRLYNSLHEEMGDFMGHWSVADGLAACYMGANKYLLFSVTNANEIKYDGVAGKKGLKAYVIDMNANHGRGAIVDSTVVVSASTHMSESIELVADDYATHKYWLIYAYNNHLHVRSVDVDNYSSSNAGSVNSIVSPDNNQTIALSTAGTTYTLKASQQHDRVAIANADIETIDVFAFDNATGTLSNRRTTPSHQVDGIAYGVEFSPDGSQLYAAGYSLSGGTPKLHQYTIAPNGLNHVDSVKYWQTHETSNPRGGGLKLGPDGNIYVMLDYETHVGIVSYPNNTTPLEGRYTMQGMELNLNSAEELHYTLQFSTGLTRPAEMACNDNNPPIPVADSAILCITNTLRTIKVNVLDNDADADTNDTIYLTAAEFNDPAKDTLLATITVNPADSTISLTIKPDVYLGATGHVFEITYHVKDNGLPASQCATGNLKITVYHTPNYPDIRIRACPNAAINLSKYLDTINMLKSVEWTSLTLAGMPVTDGNISIANAGSYTFAYTVNSACVSAQSRRMYIEVLRNGKMRPRRDTVEICHKYADAIQIDQLFGIEANGNIEPADPDIKDYITGHITTMSSCGRIMDGEAIFNKSNGIAIVQYHGKSAKIITLKYTPNPNSCLKDDAIPYYITIALTEN